MAPNATAICSSVKNSPYRELRPSRSERPASLGLDRRRWYPRRPCRSVGGLRYDGRRRAHVLAVALEALDVELERDCGHVELNQAILANRDPEVVKLLCQALQKAEVDAVGERISSMETSGAIEPEHG